MPRSRTKSDPRYSFTQKRSNYEYEDDEFDLDMQLTLELALSMTSKRKTSQVRKRQSRLSGGVKKTPVPKKRSPRKKKATSRASTISLDDSDDDIAVPSTSTAIRESVVDKVDTFFKSGGLISDDEDELLMLRPDNKQVLPNDLEPSCSTSSSSSIKTNLIETNNKEVVQDQIETDSLKDIENYCKETEDLLKNANALLEKFTSTSKEEIPIEIPSTSNAKPEMSPPGRRIGECPVCLENLAEKEVMSTKCGHLYCKMCLAKIAVTSKKCPKCRKVVNKKNIIPIYI